MPHIMFDNVTLQYPIYSAHSMSLRNQLVNLTTGGLLSQEAKNVVTITALNHVSFSLNNGDKIGLIGHNGAGKTTLLRAMAGIYEPIQGIINIEGSVSTIIELGAGMDSELTGNENIIRMGLLLGRTTAEMHARTKEIEEFAELGEFIKMPVRTYSSGMLMRLMFAVATAVSPQILLIDEMFGTGDANFQEKAFQRMTELISAADIFVFASHDLKLIQKFCQRVFRLEHGALTEVDIKSIA